jgi:hypothetical protein
MKEHPIIFSGEMVLAILEGRKTQTRRVVKPQPILMDSGIWYPSSKPGDFRNKISLHYGNENHMRKGMPFDFSPYGQPGDSLWLTQGASFDKTIPFEERFWSRVYKFDCWEWFGTTNRKKYGLIKRDNKTWATHRVSWELHNGAIPNDLHVLHQCDTPWCVNPDHLYIGTNADNVNDKVKCGRQARVGGERNGQSVLNSSQVDEIRSLYWEQNVYQKDIGLRFGIAQSQVSRIVKNKRWNITFYPEKSIGHRLLEIVNIRVERVRDISENDAMSEGVNPWKPENIVLAEIDARVRERHGWELNYRNSFHKLWNSINAKRGFGWEINPWVWVIEFQVVKP